MDEVEKMEMDEIHVKLFGPMFRIYSGPDIVAEGRIDFSAPEENNAWIDLMLSENPVDYRRHPFTLNTRMVPSKRKHAIVRAYENMPVGKYEQARRNVRMYVTNQEKG